MEILKRWGSREDFIARKSEALPTLHDEIRRWIASDSNPAVFETTGLSDGPLLSEMAASGRALIVRLDVSEEEALRRIQERVRGRHLSDELAVNRRVWRAFHDHVIPRVQADLVLDTNGRPADSVTTEIVAAIQTGSTLDR
jgi:hypothetical protein